MGGRARKQTPEQQTTEQPPPHPTSAALNRGAYLCVAAAKAEEADVHDVGLNRVHVGQVDHNHLIAVVGSILLAHVKISATKGEEEEGERLRIGSQSKPRLQ